MRPGDGEELFYSPAGVNATLQCSVSSTILWWTINGELYTDLAPELHSRGILLSTTVPHRGTRTSYIRILGNSSLNSNISICYQSAVQNEIRKACTALIIYGRGKYTNIRYKTIVYISLINLTIEWPSPPKEISAQYDKHSNLINISWVAETIDGVSQNYTIVFDDHNIMVVNVVPYFVYEQNTTDSSITCIGFIIAVNGAGVVTM